MDIETFASARFGMFIHFGLYSLMGRGEWVMNREEIPPEEMRKYALDFNPRAFNAEEVADLAVDAGMRYVVFTTMHHDGFRMYDTALSNFSSAAVCGRDFVAEMVAAARSRGLGIGLYHSLNNWFDQPDAVAALEDQELYKAFIQNTHERIRELMMRFPDIDILWYDGWWPFDAEGWQAEALNAMVRSIQPRILLNGRNGLAGDFATPEQHIGIPFPWRPWETCMTLNDNWGFHQGDHNWKSPRDIIKCLANVARGRGNLLLNIGPDGDGNIPLQTKGILKEVGRWLKDNGESIFDTDLWVFDPYKRGDYRGDWVHHGYFTARGNVLYLIATSLPHSDVVITGLEMEVRQVTVLGGPELSFRQTGATLRIDIRRICQERDQTKAAPVVLKIESNRPPVIYKTGGMRTPGTVHSHYDPVPSDIRW